EKSDGYYWDDWIKKISMSFKKSVSIDFLNQPEISYTMVFSHTNGFLAAAKRVRDIKKVFSENETKMLLREDYIGGPNIANFEYLASANRSHHAYHLSRYTALTGKKIWEHNSLVEFGGGYGNMARIIKRMNPKITYTIIDLPELLSLQYVYLTALHGEDSVKCVSDVNGKITKGKINLITSNIAFDSSFNLEAE